MGARDIANTAVEVELCGEKYKVREVGMLQILATVEAYILTKRIEKVKRISDMLDDDLQVKYLDLQTDKLPEGAKLQKQAIDLMTSGELPNDCCATLLCLGLVKDQPDMTDETALDLLTRASNVEAKLVLGVVTGSKKAKAPTSGRSKS